MFPSTEDLQREYLGWSDIDALIDHLLPQFSGEFDGLLMITLTASVHFAPAHESKLAWPTLVQFPSDALLVGRRMLIVNSIWASGRTTMFVKGRVIAAGARAATAVLHYRPKSNLFPNTGPDYYGAITNRYLIYPWEFPLIAFPLIADTTTDTRPRPPTN
jgi:hypothetical protein